MKSYKVNSYLAVLLITIAGAGAASLIVRIANRSSFVVTSGTSEAGYAALEHSILNGK